MRRLSWGRILLVSALGLSLFANFFLAGFIMKAVRDRFGGEALGMVARSYPAEFRTAFRQALREDRPAARRTIRELRQAHLALGETLAATPRDEAAVEAALARVARASEALQALVQGAMRDAVRDTAPGPR